MASLWWVIYLLLWPLDLACAMALYYTLTPSQDCVA
jgi:hypothetical protein